MGCMYYIFCIHSPVNGHLGGFHVLAIMNNASMNTEHSKTLSDMNHANIFLGQFSKAKEIKRKIKKWDLIKLRTFTEQGKP